MNYIIGNRTFFSYQTESLFPPNFQEYVNKVKRRIFFPLINLTKICSANFSLQMKIEDRCWTFCLYLTRIFHQSYSLLFLESFLSFRALPMNY